MSHGLTPHRLTSRIAALAVAALLLGGCSDEGDGDATPTPSASSSSSAPSEPTGSATPEVPELPEAATGTDDAAAVAFVEYWVELLNYGLVTGDTAPVRELTNIGTCEVCEPIFENTEAAGGPDAEGAWTLTTLTTRQAAPEDPQEVDVVVQAEVTIDGAEPAPFGTLSAGLTRTPEGWETTWLLNYQY